MSFENNCFPDDLKFVEVRPVYKTNDDLDKRNYRPTSVLSHLSKIFEKIVYNQVDNFMKEKLSNQLTGFRKNHSTQHCLMYILEIWTNKLDKGGYVRALFKDLSKAFDTLNHNLLISKLDAYGFERESLSLMKSY